MDHHEYSKKRKFNEVMEENSVDDTDIDSDYLTQSQKFGDELLIEFVRSRSFLYDKSAKEYRDVNMKKNGWTEISSILNMSISDCQTRWLRLRQRFSKERQQQELETRSGAGRPTRKNWLLYDQLSFLGQFVFQRKGLNNMSTAVSTKTSTAESQAPTQNESYEDDIYFNNIQDPLLVQAPACSPFQQSTLSPMRPSTSSSIQSSSPSPVLKTTPELPPHLRPSSAPLMRRTSVSERTDDPPISASPSYTCSAGRSKVNKKVDPVETAFVQMNSTLNNVMSTIYQNKNNNLDDTDVLIGQLVIAELKKTLEPKKTILKNKLMQLLYFDN